jgi:hypothetical protein
MNGLTRDRHGKARSGTLCICSEDKGEQNRREFAKKPRYILHANGGTVVARDGIEPPTPAFSGLRSTD